ncbi:MAG: methyltransferase family protein [Candidatus Acidiferrales bacterium]
MNFWKILAAIVLCAELPVPLYWFIVHPQVAFWRKHQRAAYALGLLVPWPGVAVLLFYFRGELFKQAPPAVWAVTVAAALFALDAWIWVRVARDLGGRRLAGVAELSGGGEISAAGIYGRVRHPRYLGMMLVVAASGMLVGTRWLWVVIGAWSMMTLGTIALEEREMRTRFGAEYEMYSQRVPRFFPRTMRPGEK